MKTDVIILGSGFSGLGMAISLQREGKRSYVVLEKGHGVGGTWRENRYPGCACDVPSHLYSFSFEQNAQWSHHFAPQREILQYLEDTARKYGVLEHCRFDTEASSCVFDETQSEWVVTTKQGETFRAANLVLGVGGLHHPKFPSVPGREKFKGPQLHSALWDDSVPLEGKRVAVIGTGASAIQLVPALAPRVKQLTLFQRTPAWVLPREDAPISGFSKWLYRVAPWFMKFVRARIYARLESRAVMFTRWPKSLRLAEWLSKKHLARQVQDPAIRERLTPKYAAGCKRILLSDDYFPAFNRSNVTLESSAVKEVTETGVITPDGRHLECDVIVWCTGFDVGAPLKRMKVTGRGGRDLGERWTERLRAYRGTTVPGFPNMFTLMGPNTGLGHNSMVYMIESQIQFVLSHLRAVDAAGAKTIEVTDEAERSFNEALDAKLPGTVWASGCTSWYLDEQGRNAMLWPGTTYAFRKITKSVESEDVQLR